jgi:cell wall assembly regulator SMI1
MPGIILAFPIVAGKVIAWRRFCQELAGSQRQMYETSRHRLGITREWLTLVETAIGSAAITTLEAPDVDRTLGQIIIPLRDIVCQFAGKPDVGHSRCAGNHHADRHVGLCDSGNAGGPAHLVDVESFALSTETFCNTKFSE